MPSIYYAIGRLSVLQKNAIDAGRIERLLQADDIKDARQILSEVGFDAEDYEQSAADYVTRAGQLIKSLTSKPQMVDAFLIRYDIENLKTLLKARSLNEKNISLTAIGVLGPDALEKAVEEHSYNAFPEALKTALNQLEKRMVVSVDPMDIDITLDKARFAYVFSIIGSDTPELLGYFKTAVDLKNYAMVIRSMHRRKPAAFVKEILIPGGKIEAGKWEKAYAKPETLPLLLRYEHQTVYASAMAAFIDAKNLARFERDTDNHLNQVFLPYRRTIDREERLLSYLFQREREAASVRLIMAGKENGFPQETIRERLRDAYA